MTLNEAFVKITHLVGYDVEKMISEASTPEEKIKLYERLSWMIPRGSYVEGTENEATEAFGSALEQLAASCGITDSDLDMNSDDLVNEADVEVVKSNVGKTPSETVKGDVNKDDKIDKEDVKIEEEQVKSRKKKVQYSLTYVDIEENKESTKHDRNAEVTIKAVPEVEGKINGKWVDKAGTEVAAGTTHKMTKDLVLTAVYEDAPVVEEVEA